MSVTEVGGQVGRRHPRGRRACSTRKRPANMFRWRGHGGATVRNLLDMRTGVRVQRGVQPAAERSG